MAIKSKKLMSIDLGAVEILTHWSGGHRIEKVGNHLSTVSLLKGPLLYDV